ncbi:MULTISPECIES: S1 RNA-binding domain-containing protein [Zobellia]|uniref:CvfB family protein n=1 Tax=Zobellia TaxID=112040 RepID=UPI001BFF8F9C|nr:MULTISPECIES: S1-like domain-containing RNA-binding protein [Zobellia]MBT9189456.1 GntR family transcriptional regulator [Zobellia russellii]MBU2973337.1 GntR family transcriptional regulator [Zobellia sp. B3R18]MDO6820827.1 S1-like domain-containing RNA-binding protein [Zobellia sp. 1_MG-2023]
MIELGNYNELEVLRDTSVGLFLGSTTGTEILLPNKYVPKTIDIGDMIKVFCYLDHEERPIATTLTPSVIRNKFGFLQVAEVNKIGAFMDWGLEKHLLVPFSEQRDKMKEGQWYVVRCYMDEVSFRLVGSNKIDKFLSNDKLTVRERQEVDLLFTRLTDLGWEVIINDQHKGLVYSNEIYKHVAVGDRTKGYIKNIRPDNKLDISLQPIGEKLLEPAAEAIYKKLMAHGGYLALHDKSDPELIKRELQMSKKTFKKGVGTLYRERKIEIKDDGIHAV